MSDTFSGADSAERNEKRGSYSAGGTPTMLYVFWLIVGIAIVGATVMGAGLLRGNIQIAGTVRRADRLFESGDMTGSYRLYAEAENLAEQYNSGTAFFTKTFYAGARAFYGKMEASCKYLGPIVTAQNITRLYGDENLPEGLQRIVDEGTLLNRASNEILGVAEFVNVAEDTAFDTICSAIDAVGKKFPEFPEYMLAYYKMVYSYITDQPSRIQYKYYCDLTDYPVDTEWLSYLYGIKILTRNEKYDEALELCARHEKTSLLYSMEMAIYRLQGNFDKVLQMFDEADGQLAATSAVARERAIVLLLKGDTAGAKQALAAFEEYESMTKQAGYVLAIIAVVEKDKQRYDEIIDILIEKGSEEALDGTVIPGTVSESVLQFGESKLTLEKLFMNGESELS